MNEQINSITQKALSDLASSLAEGRSHRLECFLKAMATFHRYSWQNTLLIFSQKPEATHVAGFRAWKKLGRWVRSGERGISILAPLMFKAKDEKGDEEQILGYKAVRVFDISQTDGRPLPDLGKVRGQPGNHIGRLMTFAKKEGITIECVEDLGGADGASAGGAIKLLRGLPPGEMFAVLAHELAHELLHQGEDFDRGTEELEAEAVSFVLCSAIGLETLERSSDYIALYRGDEKALVESFTRIQSACSRMLPVVMDRTQRRAMQRGLFSGFGHG